MGSARIPEERENNASYRRSTEQGEKGGDLALAEGELLSASFLSPVETRGTTMSVERQHQDRRMTKSAGRVQNSGVYRAVSG
jgi:hypothetical protein